MKKVLEQSEESVIELYMTWAYKKKLFLFYLYWKEIYFKTITLPRNFKLMFSKYGTGRFEDKKGGGKGFRLSPPPSPFLVLEPPG